MYEWVDIFKKDRTSVTDSECLGRPFTATSDDKVEHARAMVLKNRTVSIRDNTSTLDISEGLAQDISGFHKVCARCIPRERRDDKDKSVNTRSRLLERYRIEGENSFNLIMAGDGKQLRHRKQASEYAMEAPVTPAAKNFKIQPAAVKLTLTVFLDSQGSIVQLRLKGRMYFEMLRNEQKPAISTKLRRRLSECSTLA
jgi:hypothetical protein